MSEIKYRVNAEPEDEGWPVAEWREVSAMSPEEAARAFAEAYDAENDQYPDTREVFVWADGMAAAERYEVYGEPRRHYTAVRVP